MHSKLLKAPSIVLALALIVLSGCATGGTSCAKAQVSPEFIDGLIGEMEAVEQCCPHTVSVIDDWIAQNEP